MRVRDLQTLLLPMPPEAEVNLIVRGDFCGVHDVAYYGGEVWIAAAEPFADDGPTWTINEDTSEEWQWIPPVEQMRAGLADRPNETAGDVV